MYLTDTNIARTVSVLSKLLLLYYANWEQTLTNTQLVYKV